MWRSSAILCGILLTAPMARCGEIVKNDDSIQSGQIVAFDGKDVQLRKAYGDNALVSIPISEITRVQFRKSREVEGDWSPARDKGQLPPIWKLKCTNGDSVSGVLNRWSDSQMDVRLQVDQPVVKVPIPLVHEIWRAAPELVRSALDLKITSATEDVVFAAKDGEVIAARGTALGLENNGLAFIYEGEKKSIKTDRLLGVVLAPQKHSTVADAARFAQAHPHRLVLVNGDVLSGRWTKLKDLDATFETSWGETLQVRSETIWRIETGGTSSVFLSDLKPVR